MVWKTVAENDHYEVSDTGEVRSLFTGRVLSQVTNKKGYKLVSLWSENKGHMRLVHRLVAEAFIPNPCNKDTVNHKNGDKSDNSVSNLEWMTRAENLRHAAKNGLLQTGEEHHRAKLTRERARFIKDHYKPRDPEFGQCAMARRFGVCQHAVYDVLRGATWRDA